MRYIFHISFLNLLNFVVYKEKQLVDEKVFTQCWMYLNCTIYHETIIIVILWVLVYFVEVNKIGDYIYYAFKDSLYNLFVVVWYVVFKLRWTALNIAPRTKANRHITAKNMLTKEFKCEKNNLICSLHSHNASIFFLFNC